MAQTPIFLAFEPWLKHLYYWPLSHGSNIHIIGLWAMAQTNQLFDFEPWLKHPNCWTLSHGSNSSIIGLWAMALTHQLLDFEPWLKPPKNRTLSHGSEKFPSHDSNPHFLGVWAMAQTHIWHADFNLLTSLIYFKVGIRIFEHRKVNLETKLGWEIFNHAMHDRDQGPSANWTKKNLRNHHLTKYM